MNRKYIFIIAFVVIALLLCLLLKTCGSSTEPTPTLPIDGNAIQWQGNQDLQQVTPEQKGTHIAGFKSLVFTANQTTQQVNFVNPAENVDKLFLMTLFVDDKQLWQSGYCPAGQGYYTIELSEPLKVGSYTGYLEIKVYRTSGEQLNGANVQFDLTVQEATP